MPLTLPNFLPDIELVKSKLGKLYLSAYNDADTGGPNEDFLIEDINTVNAQILSYVKKKYNLIDAETELTAPQSFQYLRRIAFDLLIYLAHSRFSYTAISEQVTKANDNAVFALKDIANGVSLLPDISAQSSKTDFDFAFGSTPRFKRSQLRGT